MAVFYVSGLSSTVQLDFVFWAAPSQEAQVGLTEDDSEHIGYYTSNYK